MRTLTGLTWGHRRAIEPLRAAATAFAGFRPDARIEWQVRTLQDFEHQSIEDAARMVDLIVFDHPFVGRIAATGALTPLDELGATIPSDSAFIGRLAESFRWEGRQLAVPVDGATIHALYRADAPEIMEHGVPASWHEFLSLAVRLRANGRSAVLAAVGHHGLLTWMSLCSGLGAPWTAPLNTFLVNRREVLWQALEMMIEAVSLCHPDSLRWNAIDVHEVMSANANLAYCPAAYGYATYGEVDRPYRLSFAPFPGLGELRAAGTMIGGAGVGVSATCTDSILAADFLSYLARAPAQSLFAAHHGQPALAECWFDPAIDARFNGFFSAIRETLTLAEIRPRMNGYGSFEAKAGRLLQALLSGLIAPTMLFDGLLKAAKDLP